MDHTVASVASWLVLVLWACALPGSPQAGAQSSGSPSTSACAGSEIPIYDDGDGDGYGDPASEVLACAVEPGKVENAGDCDDTEPLAWTGAVDLACDGVDNDCDGVLPQCIRSLGDAGAVLEGTDPVTSRMGYPGFVGDVDGDGLEDVVTASNSTAWLLSGPSVPGFVGTVDAIATQTYTVNSMWPAPAGDTDGDGLDDFFIGVRLVQTSALGGGPALDLNNLPQYFAGTGQLYGIDTNDVDGDGQRDLLVQATESLALFLAPFTPGDAPVLELEDLDCNSGVATSADLDGDGSMELIYGGTLDCGQPVSIASFDWDLYAGEELRFRYPEASDFEMTVTGEAEIDLLQPVGDTDADGYEDLMMADFGAWYLLRGPFAGPIDPAADAVVTFDQHDPRYASNNHIEALGSAGDTDADGANEVYSYHCGGAEAIEGDTCQGALYVVRSGAAGALTPEAADAVWEGQVDDSVQNIRIASGGDLDLDGVPDLLVGSNGSDDAHAKHGGRVYWLPGAALFDGP